MNVKSLKEAAVRTERYLFLTLIVQALELFGLCLPKASTRSHADVQFSNDAVRCESNNRYPNRRLGGVRYLWRRRKKGVLFTNLNPVATFTIKSRTRAHSAAAAAETARTCSNYCFVGRGFHHRGKRQRSSRKNW